MCWSSFFFNLLPTILKGFNFVAVKSTKEVALQIDQGFNGWCTSTFTGTWSGSFDNIFHRAKKKQNNNHKLNFKNFNTNKSDKKEGTQKVWLVIFVPKHSVFWFLDQIMHQSLHKDMWLIWFIQTQSLKLLKLVMPLHVKCYISIIFIVVGQMLARETKQAMLNRWKHLFLFQKWIFYCNFVKILHDFTLMEASGIFQNFWRVTRLLSCTVILFKVY